MITPIRTWREDLLFIGGAIFIGAFLAIFLFTSIREVPHDAPVEMPIATPSALTFQQSQSDVQAKGEIGDSHHSVKSSGYSSQCSGCECIGCSGTNSEHDEIHLKNSCPYAINVAIHYNDGDKWLTSGWWDIPAGETIYIVNSFGSSVYFYGQATGLGMWDGTASAKAMTLPIRDGDSFMFIGDAPAAAGDVKWVKFFEVNTGDYYGEVVQEFTCS